MEPPRNGWVSIALYHQDTRTAFDVEGDRTRFPGNGRAVTSAVFLTTAVGLVHGVDAWAQIPVQRLRFSDAAGTDEAAGLGDARLYLRAQPLRLLPGARGLEDLPFAVRGGIKIPVGDFDVGPNLLPLGDGQRDWELLLEVGHSLWPRPLYVMAWAGYRWREALEEGRTELGNERFFLGALGGDRGRAGFKVTVDGWYGDTPILNAVEARGGEREMLRLTPSLLLTLGPGQAELGVRRPLSGRNLPAGSDLFLGYFARFGSR